MGIEALMNQIAVAIGDSLELEEENVAILRYGLMVIVQTVFSILLAAVFGGVFNVFIESIVISCIIAILRKTTGGAHASSVERCMIMGTSITVIGAIISKMLESIPNIAIVILAILGGCWSYYIIGKNAPVGNKAKPIKNPIKRIKLRKHSLIIVTIYLVLGVSIAIVQGNGRSKSCVIAILFGMCWQVFTLTGMGKKMIYKFDHFLIYILSKLGRNIYEKN